jgi:hypothetical protein
LNTVVVIKWASFRSKNGRAKDCCKGERGPRILLVTAQGPVPTEAIAIFPARRIALDGMQFGEPASQESVPRAREARVIWRPEMPRNQKAVSLSIGGHLAMGMTLGAVFALVLLFGSDPSILRMILDASSPALVLALYIGVFAMTFGLGATLTGIVLEAADEQ